MVRDEITREATLGQLLDETVARCPDTEAIVYADRDYRETWREFSATIDRVAKGLMAMGVKKGEKVAVWATNVPHWVTLQFATARIGAILLTININYKISEIEYVLRQSETENIFIIDGYRDTDYLGTLYELIPELKAQPRERLHSDKFPHLKRVLFLGPEKHRGMYSMNEVMAMGAQTSDREYQERQAGLSCYDVVNMQYTSGMCMSRCTRFITSTGQGEPAMIPVRRVEKSNFSNRVCSITAMNIVGTPYSAVHRSFSMAIITFTGSYFSRMTMVAPEFSEAITPSTQPKQWNSGTGRQMRSLLE
jgi:acyl-CoA synthetase (AMP-forming)/AMP-acid ligase II